MAKGSSFSFSNNPGMVLVFTYVALYAVNSVVLYLANMFFPAQVVLGTHALTPMWAVKLSMGTLALLGTLFVPFAHEIERMKGRDLTSQEWMVKYFILNFVGIWVITRFSQQFGLGVSSWIVVAALALVMDVAQGIVMMQVEKIRQSYS